MKKTFLFSVLTIVFVAMRSLAADGCCGSGAGSPTDCSEMSGQQHHTAQALPVAGTLLSQPVAAVFTNYIRIQTALANDSLEGVAEGAQAIAKAVIDDTANTFSATVARQAQALAKATDLPTARNAFKPLSQSLIEDGSKRPQVAGLWRQVHCPMANASWLQTDTVVNNPYLGKSMARCGEFVKGSTGQGQEHRDNSTHVQ